MPHASLWDCRCSAAASFSSCLQPSFRSVCRLKPRLADGQPRLYHRDSWVHFMYGVTIGFEVLGVPRESSAPSEMEGRGDFASTSFEMLDAGFSFPVDEQQLHAACESVGVSWGPLKVSLVSTCQSLANSTPLYLPLNRLFPVNPAQWHGVICHCMHVGANISSNCRPHSNHDPHRPTCGQKLPRSTWHGRGILESSNLIPELRPQ